MPQSQPLRAPNVLPSFEPLEQKVLLTTLYGGDYFIYRNGQGLSVRVDLVGEPTDSVELMTLNAAGDGVIDTPGLLFTGGAWQQINWPGGTNITTVDTSTPPKVEWADTMEKLNNVERQYTTSWTEIYAIYFGQCTSETRLSISVVTSNGLDPNGDWNTIDPWLPDLAENDPKMPNVAVVFEDTITFVKSPKASGGAIVGAVYVGIDDKGNTNPEDDTPIYMASPTVENLTETANPLGVYPGGPLHAGIMIPATGSSLSSVAGKYVHALSVNGSGEFFVIDSTIFRGIAVGDSAIGTSVHSITSDSAGNFYTVDTSLEPFIIGPSIGANVQAVASVNGTLYLFDEETSQLMAVFGSGAPAAIGTVTLDGSSTDVRADNIRAMDSRGSTLFAIAGKFTDIDTAGGGSVPNPNGPSLIQINRTTGKVVGSPIQLSATNGNFTGMAFDTAGTTLYAVDASSNKLVTVNITTGEVSTGVDLTVGGVALTEVQGIEFVGTTLYAATANKLYTIDVATGAGTEVHTYTDANLSGLSYDPSEGGYLVSASLVGFDYVPVVLPLGASLRGVDPVTGAAAHISVLRDASDPLLVYRDVQALDTDASGAMYAVATAYQTNSVGGAAAPVGRFIIAISDYGDVTRGVAVTPEFVSLAFNASDTLYGVTTTGNLVTVDISDPNAATNISMIGALGAQFTGIDFATIDGTEVLYGVTATNLYAIDPSTGDIEQMAATVSTGMTSLTYSSAFGGTLWASNGTGLIRIDLSSSLVNANPSSAAVVNGLLFDSVDGTWAYTDVTAMDFDSNGDLYAVGTMLSLAPFGGAAVPTTGSVLIQVAPDGTVTRIAELSDNLTSLAFDSSDLLYGVLESTHELVTIDLADPTTVVTIATLSVDTITGIDFADGVLYGVGTNRLYVIDPSTANATQLMEYASAGSLTSLAIDPSGKLWSTDLKSGSYRLTELSTDGGAAIRHVGRIKVAGVLAGTLHVGGDIEAIEAGFLWGNITIDWNVMDIILVAGGGSLGEYLPDDSTIYAGGSLGMVEVRSGNLNTSVIGANLSSVPAPSTLTTDDNGDLISLNLVRELERKPRPLEEAANIMAAWRAGQFTDLTNDDTATAQFLNHISGDLVLWGTTYAAGTDDDFYAFGMMAGQTIRINGGAGQVYLESTISSGLLFSSLAVSLYDSAGNMMDTLGYETQEDIGIGSSGSTQKPLTFKAPAAGIYYLKVATRPLALSGQSYSLFITNGTRGAVGAVSVAGPTDAEGNPLPLLGNYGSTEATNRAFIETRRGGDLGAVRITGSVFSPTVNALAGGNLVNFEAGIVGGMDSFGFATFGSFFSNSNIGRLASTVGHFSGTMQAGTTLYNENAYIQNISVKTSLLSGSDITATGSIGIIEVDGQMQGLDLQVNSDGIGLGGRVDLITVGGDWGGYAGGFPVGAPRLYHGVGGNFGFITVGGAVYRSEITGMHSVSPTVYTDGRTATLNDDGGGHLKVTGATVQVMGEDGRPLLDEFRQPTYNITRISFIVIPVEDAVGGVISNVTIDGNASLVNSGIVHVGELLANGADTVVFSGTGSAEVYHVTAGDLELFANTTAGTVVSATFDSVTTVNIKGNLGTGVGTTGAWLFGHDDAPVVVAPAGEVQFGWFRRKINGLNISGDLGTLSVGGSIADVWVGGAIGTITANSDKVTPAGKWDGIRGVIWARTSIGQINVGDGLADDGGSDVARAGIFSSGTIGTVSISGARYVQNGYVFHELTGAIIAAGGIDKITGTGGATLTAIVFAGDLDTFQCMISDIPSVSGPIGTISMSGVGAAIYRTSIDALWIGTVSTSIDSDGIWQTSLLGAGPPPNTHAIGKVLAGGPGMFDVTIITYSAGIGTISGVGSVADIVGCNFSAVYGIGLISARDLTNNAINTAGTIGTIKATRDIYENRVGGTGAHVGGINSVTVGRNFSHNYFAVAGQVSSIAVVGDYEESVLALFGPDVAWLKKMTVGGDMSGTVVSAGRIGSILVKGETIADISTTTKGAAGNVELLSFSGGFDGSLEVGGSLKRFVSIGSCATAPSATTVSQIFNIWGDLGYLRIQTLKGGPAANMYGTVNVGGSIGTVDVDGTLYGDLNTNGSIAKLMVDGSLGGEIDGVEYGSVTAHGSILSLTMGSGHDLIADITVGGSFKSLTMKGGSIKGDITVRNGSIGSLKVTNGDIEGDLTASSMGKITVTNGSVLGDISTTRGNLDCLTIVGGNLDADVTVNHGSIKKLNITNGSALFGNTISASDDILAVNIKGGDLEADLRAGGDLGKVTIKGSDIIGMISAGTGIGSIVLDGAIRNTIRSGGNIGSIKAGSMQMGQISAAADIASVIIKASMEDSAVLAGYDLGVNGELNDPADPGSFDDNPNNGGMVHRGTLGKMTVGTTMTNSVVSAGVGPGADLDFSTTGDNDIAGGTSSIVKMMVGGFVDPATCVILADTSIDSAFTAMAQAAGATVDVDYNGPLAGVGTAFGAGAPSSSITVNGLTLSIIGDGAGIFDAATGTLVLNNTTSRTKVTLMGSFALPLTVTAQEDRALGSLVADGGVSIGALAIDGAVGILTLGSIEDGSVISVLGGVATATLEGDISMTMTAGAVGKMTLIGSLTGGSITADSFGILTVLGSVDGDIATILNGAKTVFIGGNLGGEGSFQNHVGSVKIAGNLSGTLTVLHGELGSLIVGGDISGAVNVANGRAGTVTITGDLGGTGDSSFRADLGIGKLTITQGNFSGILSSNGNLDRLMMRAGEFSGRLAVGGTIKTVTLGSMDGGLLCAGGDITTVTIVGDMGSSMILAGFNPGDAGFAANGGTEDGNVELDAASPEPIHPDNVDAPIGGNIRLVTIGGSMFSSSIGAAVDPGVDGFLGSNDDVAGGIGTIGKVVVKRLISGSDNMAEQFAIEAATNVPTVTSYGQPFMGADNMAVRELHGMAGDMTITMANLKFNSLTIFFSHPLNFSTINDNSMSLLAGATDLNPTITYDPENWSVTFRFASSWDELGVGSSFQLTFIGDQVADNRDNLLDGEYVDTMPTGDGVSGGDFVYGFQYGMVVLEEVPAYGLWWHGCAPTSAGMLVGYYDGMPAYSDLIPGSAAVQDAVVNEAIASQGHVDDYAWYQTVNDSDEILYLSPYPDRSVIDPGSAHADDSIADFMGTSRSALGLRYGGTYDSGIVQGIEQYFSYKGYTADAELAYWGMFTWDDFTQEIDQGRPVLVGVDHDGNGYADHEIIGIGYDMASNSFAAYNTWDDQIHWYEFTEATLGHEFGVTDIITVTVS